MERTPDELIRSQAKRGPPQPPPDVMPHRISTSLQKTYRFPAGRGD